MGTLRAREGACRFSQKKGDNLKGSRLKCDPLGASEKYRFKHVFTARPYPFKNLNEQRANKEKKLIEAWVKREKNLKKPEIKRRLEPAKTCNRSRDRT